MPPFSLVYNNVRCIHKGQAAVQGNITMKTSLITATVPETSRSWL